MEYLPKYAGKKEILTQQVIEQIKEDIKNGDIEAIDELLRFVPIKNLKGYLTQD